MAPDLPTLATCSLWLLLRYFSRTPLPRPVIIQEVL
jgi:hypothetical protein